VAARTLAPASPASVDAPDPVPGTDVAAARPTVALLRFTGGTGSTGAEQAVRDGVRAALEREGVPVRLVALGREQAASKAKCPTPSDDACLGKIVEWLGTSPKTAADVLVVGERRGDALHVVVFDARAGERVAFTAVLRQADLVLPIVLPEAIARAVIEPGPRLPTPEEQAALAALEEPERTSEERAAEAEAVAAAEARASTSPEPSTENVETTAVEVDLKQDFAAFCRTGPRRPRASRDDAKDLRPVCGRGPFWGYWQPRAYVALALTSASAIATLGIYAAALAARAPYRRAVDAVEAFERDVGGDPTRDPTRAVFGDRRYDVLAYEVGSRGAAMRELAITGDVMLGVTALLGTVLAVIIAQDRRDARAFLREEKQMQAISGLRVGPWWRRDLQGAALHFSF